MALRVSAVPPFSGLRRFPDGRDFKQWTGDDSKALMKVSNTVRAMRVPTVGQVAPPHMLDTARVLESCASQLPISSPRPLCTPLASACVVCARSSRDRRGTRANCLYLMNQSLTLCLGVPRSHRRVSPVCDGSLHLEIYERMLYCSSECHFGISTRSI